MAHPNLSPSRAVSYRPAIAALKKADPVLAALITQVGPCTLKQDQDAGDLLMVLSQAIISQQLSLKAAATIYQRFLNLFPELLTPTNLLATSDETLRGVGISRSKIMYLKSLSQHILDGLPDLEELATLEDDVIVQTLTQVKGIGRWTVEMLLIFRLHRWDVLPVNDLGIRTATRKLYSLTDLPNQKTLEQLGKPWQPYRSIASWYLWRSLEL
jgi:DNA-3-methyladenine glycosylase II